MSVEEQARALLNEILDKAFWTYSNKKRDQVVGFLHDAVFDSILAALRAASSAATEKERERAAKIAENYGPSRPLGPYAGHSTLLKGRHQGEQAASLNIALLIRGDEQEGAPQDEKP